MTHTEELSRRMQAPSQKVPEEAPFSKDTTLEAKATKAVFKNQVLLVGCAQDKEKALKKAHHRCTSTSCDSFTLIQYPILPKSKRNADEKIPMEMIETLTPEKIDYDKCVGQRAYLFSYFACAGMQHKTAMSSFNFSTEERKATKEMITWCTNDFSKIDMSEINAGVINGLQTGDDATMTQKTPDRTLKDGPTINTGVINGMQTGDDASMNLDLSGQTIINTKQYKECEGSGNGGEKGAAQVVCCKSKGAVCCASAAQSKGNVKVKASDCPASHPYAGKWEQGEEVLKSRSGPWAPLALGGCALAVVSGVGWACRRSRRPHGQGRLGESEDSGLTVAGDKRNPSPEDAQLLLDHEA